ncbi:MAG: retropepsin-like aspartic protease [Planctomycetota bacterium]|nr:retropepsin-like aspartic protease [Planctomycetota bacterium]
MGMVYADIELINGFDLLKVEAGELDERELRRMPVRILVDSGAATLVINDTIRAQLGLKTKEERVMQLADESIVALDVVGPVEIRFENRRSMLDAVVLPGNAEPLLGAMPMQARPPDHRRRVAQVGDESRERRVESGGRYAESQEQMTEC